MFKSEEEKRQDRKMILTLLLIGAVLIAMLFGTIQMWKELKPLPNIPRCEDAGYEAGAIENGREVCYKNCRDNVIASCVSRRIMI